MANLSEDNQFPATVYQIEPSDLVLGGPAGVVNLQAGQLTRRTRWLYNWIADNVVASALAGKLLRLDNLGRLPADITGNAATADRWQTLRKLSLSGDAMGSALLDGGSDPTLVLQLAATTVAAGNYGAADKTLSLSVNAQGRLTAASHQAIQLALAQVSGLVAALNGKQASLGFTPESTANKGAANGYAGLGADGKIPAGQLPALAITDTFVVASEAALLALMAEPGDVAIRTDLRRSFILRAAPAGTLANWQELLTPDNQVASINGQTGAVVLSAASVGAAAVAHSHALPIGDGGIQRLSLNSGQQLNFAAGSNVALAFNDATKTVTISTSGQISGNVESAGRWQFARALSLTGDITGSIALDGSADTYLAATLANTGVVAGSYGSATHIPVLTFDTKGRVTAASLQPIAPGWDAITSKPTTLAGYGITDAASLAGNTFTAPQTIAGSLPAGTALATIGSTGQGLMLRASGNGGTASAAVLTFLRPGSYGAYFGLDVDNKWKVGGWSAGAVAYELWHAGNSTRFTGSLPWASLTGTPTTLAAAGITDAAPLSHSHAGLSPARVLFFANF
ncbi:hypothetical protein FNU76_15845 [Chitinimonas arctica]|uniref:Uncharacterized protein n=1 Tax=Chitinimonas arctica TaxID=2594795 RepID=A0A516SHS6_9NEIS|nr:hypothetical protein [Chitinimonas arctica]QDQ27704.1 hypothetical protein FNU76_15845 [Chitinimonas arctica]